MQRLVATLVVFAVVAPWLPVPVATGQSIIDLDKAGLSARAQDCLIYAPPGTSSDYLLAATRCLHTGSSNPTDQVRHTLIEDIAIKTWAYSLLNKVFFWSSLSLALAVLLFPSAAPILQKRLAQAEGSTDDPTRRAPAWLAFLASSGFHTSLTAVAALSFAAYLHYKSNQSQAETLMRRVFFAEQIDARFIDGIIGELGAIDRGFQFTVGQN